MGGVVQTLLIDSVLLTVILMNSIKGTFQVNSINDLFSMKSPKEDWGV